MSVLLIKCPRTGKRFSTGILTDIPVHRLPDATLRSRCPYCGGEHQWRSCEAMAVESVPRSEWVENQMPGPSAR